MLVVLQVAMYRYTVSGIAAKLAAIMTLSDAMDWTRPSGGVCCCRIADHQTCYISTIESLGFLPGMIQSRIFQEEKITVKK